MAVLIEVFLGYTLYVLLFSFCNSSEESVILGWQAGNFLLQLEESLVNRVGCLIPYSLVYLQAVHGRSLFVLAALVAEIIAYALVKDSVVVYLKGLNLFLSPRSKVCINPSGHTFMFLNGVFLLVPVVSRGIKRRDPRVLLPALIFYEYNRMLCNTALYYHPFCDVALGVIIFCLFRSLVCPVRKVYEMSSYRNEWGVKGYLGLALGVLLAMGGIQIFLWLSEDLGALSS